MAEFSRRSKEKLSTCDSRLQMVFREVIKYFDCIVLEGHRGKEKQNQYYSEGRSKVQFPNGKHNKVPSGAVDVMPYPIDWNDIERLCYFAGFVMGIANQLGVNLRWGKDWDRDTDLNDQSFKDGPHFELVN